MADYSKVADKIHGRGTQSTTYRPTTQSLLNEWKTHVNSRESAEHFYMKNFSHFPTQLCQALADVSQRKASGELTSSPIASRKNTSIWDPTQELEEAKMEGLMNLTKVRLDKLLDEELGDQNGGHP